MGWKHTFPNRKVGNTATQNNTRILFRIDGERLCFEEGFLAHRKPNPNAVFALTTMARLTETVVHEGVGWSRATCHGMPDRRDWVV